MAHIVLIGLSHVTLLICVSHIVVLTSSLVLILNMANLVKQENTSIFFHWLHQHTAVFSLVSCVGQRRLVIWSDSSSYRRICIAKSLDV